MKHHLTETETTVSADMIQATRPGMCSWAGTGPDGATCGTCGHWEGRAHHNVDYCTPGRRIVGRRAQKIPGDMAAFRSWVKEGRA